MNENKLQIYKNKISFYRNLINQVGGDVFGTSDTIYKLPQEIIDSNQYDIQTIYEFDEYTKCIPVENDTQFGATYENNSKIRDNLADFGIVFTKNDTTKNPVFKGFWYKTDYSVNRKVRKGKLFEENGIKLKYDGEWNHEDQKFKAGIKYINGIKTYAGQFKNDMYHGKGTLYFENGNKKYKGEFKNDMYHGEGTLYNENQGIIRQGSWKNGQFIGQNSNSN